MTAPSKHKSAQKRNKIIRLSVLVFVLVLTTIIGLLHLFGKGFVPVSIEALCPFGAIESAYTLYSDGKFLKRIDWSNFILLFAVLLVALLFKRAFCGLLCPLGALQELSYKLRTKFSRHRYTVPPAIDKPLRFLKYPILAAIIFFSALLGEMVFRPYDPWVAYHHLLSEELLNEFFIGLIVLIITLVGSFFYDRFFCKYLCPMGALLALLAPLGLTGIRRNETTCINCQACNRVCPVNIDVTSQQIVTSAECINCNECINACPVSDTLYLSSKKTLKIPDRRALETVVIVFALVIGLSTFTGDFKWQKPSLASTVENTGSFEPSLIKGKNSLNEVIELTQIPAQAFINKFQITEQDFVFPIKETGKKYGFGTEDIRNFVGEYLKKNGGS